MPASSIQLSPSVVLDLAKETLFLMKCDWDGCTSILNSWRTLRQVCIDAYSDIHDNIFSVANAL
jgi:hypothetical protein